MKLRIQTTSGLLAIVLITVTGCGALSSDAKSYDSQTRSIVKQTATIVEKFQTDLKRFAAAQGSQIGATDFEMKITSYLVELSFLQNDVNDLTVPDDMKGENQLLSQSIDDSYHTLESFYRYLQTNDSSIISGDFKTYSQNAADEILQFRQTLNHDEGN